MTSTLTAYQVGAALEVARHVDPEGNDTQSLEAALRHAATEGTWPYEQLERARALLTDAQLLTSDTAAHRLSAVAAVAVALPDDQALISLRRLLLQSLAPDADDARRAEVGAQAETHVVMKCREQLEGLGHVELGAQVQRVSLISDHFGYDVAAPTIDGPTRLLEVKGTTRTDRAVFQFFVSRNEYDVGRRNPSWSLVACQVSGRTADVGGLVTIVGHCLAATLDPYLPDDRNGRWTEASVSLPRYLLLEGLPSPVP